MTLIQTFATTAARRPDKVALITERNQLSFADLLGLVGALDHGLAARGVRPGQVVVAATRRAEVVLALAMVASLRSLTLAFTDVATARAAGLAHDWHLRTEPPSAAPDDRLILIDAGWFARTASLPPLDAGGQGATFVFQTSGSTGRPKLVRSDEGPRFERARRDYFAGSDTAGGRRFLTTLSANTGYAMNGNLTTLLAGGSVVSLREDQDRLLQYIDLYRIDTLDLSPALAQRMLEVPGADQYLTSLRDLRLTGAMASPALLAALSRLVPARICYGYGSVEMGRLFDAVHDPDRPQALGHVGRLVRPEVEVLFCDDSLTPVPGATEGIVAFRATSPAFARGYLGGGDTGDGTGFRDGLFFPGDIMRREGDDYFVIGRTKNILNFSGNKVSLDALAAALAEVFPSGTFVPLVDHDAMGLERLVIAYRAPVEIAAQGIEAALARRFARLGPVRVDRVQDLPLTPSGKVDVPALRAALGLC